MAKVESKYIINCVSDTDAGPIHCVAVSGRFIEIKSAIIKIGIFLFFFYLRTSRIVICSNLIKVNFQ